jgi:hypothetical protein
MKRLSAIIIAVLFCAGTAAAQGIIVNFTAHAENDDYAVLEWASGSENGLLLFRVERSLDGLTFTSIAELAPQGSNSDYRYEDHDLYKTSPRTYYYRIRALMTSGTSTLSPVQSVTLAFSGIQQTWGSIKALFR